MQSLNTKQYLLIVGALLLIVLLYFAPKNQKPNSQDNGHEHEELSSSDPIAEAKKLLSETTLKSIEELEKQNTAEAFDKIVAILDTTQQPLASALYAEKSARIKNTEEAWQNAADHFFFAASFTIPSEKQLAYDGAIRSYEKVLELNPNNIDAQINLGACYVEASSEPMKGIGLLRTVLEKDSTNIKAHLNLGLFSVKSGQFDKAIERFNKVLTIDPNYIEAYLYIGDVYEQKGDINNAIKHYELYVSAVKNPNIAADVTRYIEKLKKEITN
ncbi:MAG: tetratricopeptide repeat protein [Bacteroidia bacterium]